MRSDLHFRVEEPIGEDPRKYLNWYDVRQVTVTEYGRFAELVSWTSVLFVWDEGKRIYWQHVEGGSIARWIYMSLRSLKNLTTFGGFGFVS